MGIGAAPPIPVSSILVITAINVSGASPPTIGTLAVRIRQSAGLRNVPPVCQSSAAISPFLIGGFGPSKITITDLLAAPPSKCNMSSASISRATYTPGFQQESVTCNSKFGNGDRLNLIFNQNVTLCLGGCSCVNSSDISPYCERPFDNYLNKSQLDAAFSFSQELGLSYIGKWLSKRQLEITVLNSSGATPPGAYVLVVSVKENAMLRNFPPTGDISNPLSPLLCSTAKIVGNLNCGFGPPDLQIERIVASSGGLTEGQLPAAQRGRPSPADIISIQFNQATNGARPFLCHGGQMEGTACKYEGDNTSCLDLAIDPYSGKTYQLHTGGTCIETVIGLGIVVPKQTVDAMFEMSTQLASDYTGIWVDGCAEEAFDVSRCDYGQGLSARRFEITIKDVDTSQSPSTAVSVGCGECVNAHPFTIRARVTADIRNNPATSMPAGWGGMDVVSPPLEGNFGPSTVSITWLVADDPISLYQWYSPGDTITVVFDQPTNLAGLPVANIRYVATDQKKSQCQFLSSSPRSDYLCFLTICIC